MTEIGDETVDSLKLLEISRSAGGDQQMIVVCIPAHNETKFIGSVVYEARKYAHQVIVVDDGSSDGTSETAEAFGAPVVTHAVRRGAGGATKSCFEAARSVAADVLVTLDGDGQHSPDEIPRLIAPILEGKADLVVGSRFLNGQDTIPKYRKLGIKLITWLHNLWSKVEVSDAQSCFRAYGKKAIYSLDVTQQGFGFSVELLWQAAQQGLSIVEVPITCRYHAGCHTANPVTHGMEIIFTLAKLKLQNRANGRL